jgi:hypothetical protein
MKVVGSASPACLIRRMSKDVSAKPETELDNETLLVLGFSLLRSTGCFCILSCQSCDSIVLSTLVVPSSRYQVRSLLSIPSI